MEIDYKAGHLDTVKNHKTLIDLELMNTDKYDANKKYLVTIVDEAENWTNNMINLIHGLFRLLYMANCMNEKLDDPDKIKDFFKIKLGLIETWGYVSDENRLKLVKERSLVPENKLAIPYKPKSFSRLSKKGLGEVIDYVLIYCDNQNMHGNLGAMEKKYLEIRNQLDGNRG